MSAIRKHARSAFGSIGDGPSCWAILRDARLRRVPIFVMAGFVPAIHVLFRLSGKRTWMPGTRPGMTGFGTASFASDSPRHRALPGRQHALIRIDGAEALDDAKTAAGGLGDVHVHSNVVLARHHCGAAAGSFGDLCVIERRDHVFLPKRTGFFHRRFPELDAAIKPRAAAASGELLLARIIRVVLREQVPAEGVVNGLVVVEAAIDAL